METPSRSYIICATPRSGTTLLCDLLSATGVTGCPDSFFRGPSYPWWADYFGLSTDGWDHPRNFDRDYLAAALKEGLGRTEMFGMRLMWESVADLLVRLDWFYPGLPNDAARLEAAFGPPVYLYLSREDKVAQAVSHLRAEQSGLWHRHADGSERERLKAPAEPSYDYAALAQLVEEAETHNASWLAWFEQQGVTPVPITYEELSAEPQKTLARILSALDLDPAIAKGVKPISQKLANEESRNWANRFRLEQ